MTHHYDSSLVPLVVTLGSFSTAAVTLSVAHVACYTPLLCMRALLQVGCAFGSFCSGMAADKLGRRMASILGAALYTVGKLCKGREGKGTERKGRKNRNSEKKYSFLSNRYSHTQPHCNPLLPHTYSLPSSHSRTHTRANRVSLQATINHTRYMYTALYHTCSYLTHARTQGHSSRLQAAGLE